MEVYLNGRWMPYEEACIPVEDRGFLFADGVYEVIHYYGGHPFELEGHLDRLEESAREIRLPEFDRGEIRRVCNESVRRNQLEEAGVYVQLTRGVAPRVHSFPEKAQPTVFVMARPEPPHDPQMYQDGVACITLPDRRWSMCHVKSVGLLANVLARQEAIDAGAKDAIFVRDGLVTEASAANVFAVREGRLYTHPEGPHILSGITRQVVIEMAREDGMPVVEEAVAADDLPRVDEVFLTSTMSEIVPVVRIDGRPVGAGRPGPVTGRVRELFGARIERVRAGVASS